MNDLISRAAAIDAADRADYTGLAVEDVKKVTDEVVKELKQFPYAQPSNSERCVYQAGYAVGYRKGYMDAQQKHTKENRA